MTNAAAFEEIRSGVRALCAQFPDEYFRKVDADRGYPGETVRFQLWKRDSASLHLRARVDAREAIVLNNGLVELA